MNDDTKKSEKGYKAMNVLFLPRIERYRLDHSLQIIIIQAKIRYAERNKKGYLEKK